MLRCGLITLVPIRIGFETPRGFVGVCDVLRTGIAVRRGLVLRFAVTVYRGEGRANVVTWRGITEAFLLCRRAESSGRSAGAEILVQTRVVTRCARAQWFVGFGRFVRLRGFVQLGRFVGFGRLVTFVFRSGAVGAGRVAGGEFRCVL